MSSELLHHVPGLDSTAPPREPAARLARDHLVAHLDADLRWLELAVERVATTRA
ncbi:MAG: hypothetical protein LC777_20375 [Actinobacteria bacterium]|nr:hypothetical protein [Actinomycetota bacterium]